eukprot:scaffold38647_cov24-Tisochrysis_lutea.AAC.2
MPALADEERPPQSGTAGGEPRLEPQMASSRIQHATERTEVDRVDLGREGARALGLGDGEARDVAAGGLGSGTGECSGRQRAGGRLEHGGRLGHVVERRIGSVGTTQQLGGELGARCEERVAIAVCDDAARFEQQHAVERVQVTALRDAHDGGAPTQRGGALLAVGRRKPRRAHVAGDRVEDNDGGACVDGRKRVIKEQQVGPTVQRARQRDALLLAAAKRDAALAHLGELAQRQLIQVVEERAPLENVAQQRLVERSPEQDIVEQRAANGEGPLRHDGYARVERERAPAHRRLTPERGEKRRLAGTHRPDERDDARWLDGEGEAAQHVDARAVRWRRALGASAGRRRDRRHFGGRKSVGRTARRPPPRRSLGACSDSVGGGRRLGPADGGVDKDGKGCAWHIGLRRRTRYERLLGQLQVGGDAARGNLDLDHDLHRHGEHDEGDAQ